MLDPRICADDYGTRALVSERRRRDMPRRAHGPILLAVECVRYRTRIYRQALVGRGIVRVARSREPGCGVAAGEVRAEMGSRAT